MLKQHSVISCDAEGCKEYTTEVIGTSPGYPIAIVPMIPAGWYWLDHGIHNADVHGRGITPSYYCPKHRVIVDIKVEER